MAKEKKPAADKTIEGVAEEVKKKKKTSPMEFAQQVLQEGRKVTWTTRNETVISTVMVLIMVLIMAVFFFAVDWGLRLGVCSILDTCVPLDRQ
jgi:preprotein translocase subunit SecE